MQSELTLRLEKELIDRAKAHGELTGKSLSQLVADYFRLLAAAGPDRPVPKTPLTASLRGILPASTGAAGEYRRQMAEKHL